MFKFLKISSLNNKCKEANTRSKVDILSRVNILNKVRILNRANTRRDNLVNSRVNTVSNKDSKGNGPRGSILSKGNKTFSKEVGDGDSIVIDV